MSDLVERLRRDDSAVTSDEAADEIERLTAELETERKVTAAMGQQQRALQADIAKLERVVAVADDIRLAWIVGTNDDIDTLTGRYDESRNDLEADDE